LAFASRGSIICGVFGELVVFCFFGGGGKVEGDGPEFNAAKLCGVGVFGVEGCDWYLGEEPPYEERFY
jgi:hypothetical protein